MILYQRGSKGPEVVWIQVRLQEQGYYQGAIDGDYGGATESAVKRFQRESGLSQDGQVGPITWRELFSVPPADGAAAASSSAPGAALSDATAPPPEIPAPSVGLKAARHRRQPAGRRGQGALARGCPRSKTHRGHGVRDRPWRALSPRRV